MNLIPEPRQIKMRKGSFTIASEMNIVVSENTCIIGTLLQKELRAIADVTLGLKVESGTPQHTHILIHHPHAEKASESHDVLGKEGYILTVEKEGIRISGLKPAGIFYGVQTLLQLLENDRCIPCLEIRDRPAMEMRGVHLMLQDQMPTYDYLVSFVKQLSRYKINTLVLEYEDKFPYEKHPVLRHPLALTKPQIANLIAVAKEHFIEVIPLLQCFAHVGYILRHEKYEHLRERMESSYQYCVSNPESSRLFKDLASEILALHKESRYFHIGGDETYYMGECPLCKKECDRIGKSKFFVKYIQKAARYIKDAGKTPVIWDDQLARYPEALGTLPKYIRIMYWDYVTSDAEEVPYVKWDNRVWFGEEIFERIPGKTITFFKKYWDGGRFPQANTPFPYLRFYRDKGFKVIGAPAFLCGGTGRINTDDRLHIANIRGFARRIADTGQVGVVATSWSGCGGVLESAWHGIAAAGAFSWNPAQPRTDFDRKFTARFFGTQSSELAGAMYFMGGSITPLNSPVMKKRTSNALASLNKIANTVKKNRLTLDYLILQCRMRLFFIHTMGVCRKVEDKIVRYLDYTGWQKDKRAGNQGILSYVCPKEAEHNFSRESLQSMLTELRKVRDALPPLKTDIMRFYAKTMEKKDVERVVSCLYGQDEQKIESYISELNYLIVYHKLEEYKNGYDLP